MEAGNYKDALSLLEKSLKMNRQILGETHPSNAQILLVIGQVYTRQKEFDRALTVLAESYMLFELSTGKESEHVGNCFLEMAAIHNKKKDITEAINYQKRALSVFSNLEKFNNTEFLAAISITLAELQEKDEQNENALESLRVAKQILEDNYSTMDKRTCKVKRNISLLYLKLNKYAEALEELKQVEVSCI
jgi:tetratricopeptide (TPR) repeat protein